MASHLWSIWICIILDGDFILSNFTHTQKERPYVLYFYFLFQMLKSFFNFFNFTSIKIMTENKQMVFHMLTMSADRQEPQTKHLHYIVAEVLYTVYLPYPPYHLQLSPFICLCRLVLHPKQLTPCCLLCTSVCSLTDMNVLKVYTHSLRDFPMQ